MQLIKYIFILIASFSLNLVNAENEIDIKIESINTLGSWEHQKNEGVYRFILYQYGFEHVRGELWIQWLKWEVDKDGLYTHKALAAELPIKEVNSLNYALEQPTCIIKWPCSEFTIMAYSTFEGIPNKKFKLTTNSIGSYKIEEVEL